MAFWHDLITQKSFEVLQELKPLFPFTLIGGWAVYLYTQALKSKDIDLIVPLEKLGEIKRLFPVTKNDRLKKYEAKKWEIDIDIYVPYFSNPGLPAELITEEIVLREGFTIPKVEVLLALKLNAFEERKHSVKGEKDKLDILSLLQCQEMDPPTLTSLLKKHHKEGLLTTLIQMIQSTRKVPELKLNEAQMARLRKKLLPTLQ